MKMKEVKINRNLFSNVLTAFFGLFVVLSAIYTDFFQAPQKIRPELERLRTFISKATAEQITKIKITNRLGSFDLKKDPDNQWYLIFARPVPAKLVAIDEIIATLVQMRVRQVYRLDSIGLSNYSLENPVTKLEIEYASGARDIIGLGIHNPNDNSIYISSEEHKAIYHIDSPKFSFEGVNISSLIESRPFYQAVEQKGDFSLTIFQGAKSKNTPILFMKKKGGIWLNSADEELDQAKIQQYLHGLGQISAPLLLDRPEDQNSLPVQQIVDSPQYTLEVEDLLNGQKQSFSLGSLNRSLEGVSGAEAGKFLLVANNQGPESGPYFLVPLDQLKKIYQSGQSFK